MKKSIVFTAFLALFVMATLASAQKTDKAPADFSGTWNLDTSKGSLGPGGPMIKSQTLTIKQEGNKISLSTKTERNPPPADAPAGGGGGRPGGGGFGGGGDQSFTLDGKEMSMDQPGPGGATIPVKMTGKWDGNKVVTTTVRTTTGQDGSSNTSTTKSTYELGADGKSLTVTRDQESPRGKSSTTSVYSKG